jgi:hypothetical protein
MITARISPEISDRRQSRQMTTPPITDLADVRTVRRQSVLGGLINQYPRAA